MSFSIRAAEYQSVEEMMAGYAAVRARMMPKPAARIAPPPPKPKKAAWWSPAVVEMRICAEPLDEYWRRFVDGVAFVLVGDEEEFCPILSRNLLIEDAAYEAILRIPQLPNGATPVTPEDLFRAVCWKHKISKNEMRCDRRLKTFVLARQELCWLLRELTTWSHPRIARYIGRSDHTTALHACRRHQALVDAGRA